jgi:DNA-binding IclR family transcriptional regulator
MKSVEGNRYHVPGLDRALSVIELLNNHPEGLRVNDISERLGFPINSVYRIMNTLEHRAYARKKPDGSGYVLSEKFLTLATPASGDPGFLENALPVMRRLRDLTKETVLAGVLLNDRGVVLEQVPGLHTFSFKINPGHRFYLHTAAPGKAMLATLPDDECQAYLKRLDFPRFNDRTITSVKAFSEELKTAKKEGYAVDHAEEIVGQHCIGSAVLDRQGLPVGAIWITGPSARLAEKDFPTLGKQIREHAEQISHAMGHIAFKVA